MKVLWLLLVWPEPTSSAAGVRTGRLLRALQDAGHTVFAASPCGDNPFRATLEQAGIATASFPPNDSRFDTYITDLQPDIVIFDRFMIEEQFGARVRACVPNALRVLDTVDLHFLRKLRERLAKEKRTTFEESELISEETFREIASILRSDRTLIISQVERDFLLSHFPVRDDSLFFLPITTEKRLKDMPSFHERRHFSFIGNFLHPPNRDAVRVLREEIWPNIRHQLPEEELHIYGAYPPESLKQQESSKLGFFIRGWTEDAQRTLASYRVNLAPLRFGAGQKGKILDGWCSGTPCVGTRVAAEGMGEPFGGAVTDDMESFSDAAARLYRDEEQWRSAQEAGFKLIEQEFQEELHIPRFLEALPDWVTENREQKNFLTELLWYEQFRSTEYFSRWIEEKEKRTSQQRDG